MLHMLAILQDAGAATAGKGYGLIGAGIRLPLIPLAPQYHAVVASAMVAAGVQVAAA